ncbi:MAG TPA: hypothetical protein ACFYEM_03090 [Candidatus Hypogeohydataceae bacterium YC40]
MSALRVIFATSFPLAAGDTKGRRDRTQKEEKEITKNLEILE